MRLSRLLVPVLAASALCVPAEASAAPKYYLSLGDSYSQGYQPIGPKQADIPTNNGYTDFLGPQARKVKGYKGLKVVKLGCGGATTGSMLDGSRRCEKARPYASTSPATSQLAYATKFMRRHRGQITLVTLSVGGNDVAPCGAKPTFAEIAGCVNTGLARIKKNLPIIAAQLRKAAGAKAVIIGSTYPDVVLGQYVKNDQGKTVASASVTVFRDQINPTLKNAYAAKRIRFVDATAAFGAYIPFTQTTTLAPYGDIPVAVANICTLAWYCDARAQGPDIHLKPAGYRKMADAYLAALRKR
ncbi:MAG TPA: SGNH/GDSL hydrolase family protein [Solirubrobacteraceae bacterium]|jgi:lysophospholipase L1-like esterase|nr:SGNH/GDSL hydrolase family protein [Solirubrobacteraceae bacterium]